MRVVQVSADAPQTEVLREAAELLRSGRLVAFPTETVYGLGAHALDEGAVRLIYDAKGRPDINPLIVHVASAGAARDLTTAWSDGAQKIADAFWPGPVTIVVPKHASIPGIVTAGLDTVGLRVPAHPVALALLAEAAIPVAAPSANVSNQVSPTTAQHVVRGLGERVDLVLDGGPTSVGIESTVVDMTRGVPRILRPGMISRDALARVVGRVDDVSAETESEAPRSPGMLGRHYAPRARIRMFAREELDAALADARRAVEQGGRVGAMVFTPIPLDVAESHAMPTNPGEYARALYATLHALDDKHSDMVLVERPPRTDEWAAITDRLERAAK